MIKSQPDPSIIPRYCNISTFARLPQRNEVSDIKIGIPFDSGCTFRNGAHF